MSNLDTLFLLTMILAQLGTIIFFIAFIQMMYYLGVMQWVIEKLSVPYCDKFSLLILYESAWFFFKLLNVSGAEAVVAAASPFVGQGESACLVRPYVDRKSSLCY